MDESRFDAMARSVAEGSSRRGVLKTLGAALLGGAAVLTGTRAASAQTCREPGRLCAQNGDCCSGLCQSNRCGPLEACPPNIQCIGATGPRGATGPTGPAGAAGTAPPVFVSQFCSGSPPNLGCFVACPSGTRASGGGFSGSGNGPNVHVLESRPRVTNGVAIGWGGALLVTGTPPTTLEMTVYALCV